MYTHRVDIHSCPWTSYACSVNVATSNIIQGAQMRGAGVSACVCNKMELSEGTCRRLSHQ